MHIFSKQNISTEQKLSTEVNNTYTERIINKKITLYVICGADAVSCPIFKKQHLIE